MIGVGAALVLIKGLLEKRALPERIAAAQEKVESPILENKAVRIRKRINRFSFVRSIHEASLLQKLESTTSEEEKLQIKLKHCQTLRKEFKMRKSDLEKATATKADVAVLGLALHEIALCLDEHVRQFKEESKDEVDKFKSISAKDIEALKETHDKFEKGFVELSQRHNLESSRIKTDFESLMRSLKKNAESSVDDLITRHAEAFEQFSEKAGKVLDALTRESERLRAELVQIKEQYAQDAKSREAEIANRLDGLAKANDALLKEYREDSKRKDTEMSKRLSKLEHGNLALRRANALLAAGLVVAALVLMLR